MNTPIDHNQDPARRRRGVRRTALAFGLIALSIYVAFILSGVIGR